MNRPNRLAASLVSLSLVALGARPGAAQSPAAEREATARLREGLELARIEKWEEARLAFRQAYALLPSAELLWNLAIAELNAGLPLEALRHFREYEGHPRAEANKREALGQLMERASHQLGHIKMDAAPGTTIQIDGTVSDPATWDGDSIDVAPGEHLVSAELAGAREDVKVTVAAGGTAFVRAGWYSASDKANEAARRAASLPSAETPQDSDPSSPFSAKTWVVFGLGAAATASFAIATGYGLSANGNRERAEAFQAVLPPSCRDSSACAEWRDVVAAQQQEARISTALWISGGALAGAAIATFLLWPGKKPRETARASSTFALVPLAGGGTVHVAVPY
jgi:tetratricopeptide (TPR) repeat protein